VHSVDETAFVFNDMNHGLKINGAVCDEHGRQSNDAGQLSVGVRFAFTIHCGEDVGVLDKERMLFQHLGPALTGD
jgi:hypothetical protein